MFAEKATFVRTNTSKFYRLPSRLRGIVERVLVPGEKEVLLRTYGAGVVQLHRLAVGRKNTACYNREVERT